MTRLFLAALALACALSMPAFAAEVVTASDSVLDIPWGNMLAEASKTTVEILVPILIAVATWAVGKAPWWISMWLTTQRVDRMVRLAADYAVNAVAGATHDKAVSVDVGIRLLKVGLERAMGSTPGWVLDAAGGPKGITERLFRTFRFDETVSDANTLTPVIEALPDLPFVAMTDR